MLVITFQGKVVAGMIKLPEHLLEELRNKDFTVTITVDPNAVSKQIDEDDFIEELIRNPPEFDGPFLTRDEIYERDRDRRETGGREAYPHLFR